MRHDLFSFLKRFVSLPNRFFSFLKSLVMNLALILLSLWIISFGLGSDVYANFVSIFETIFVKIVVYFIVLGISYHALNGIRHILWDFGFMISNKAASISGVVIIISTIVLSFLISNFVGLF